MNPRLAGIAPSLIRAIAAKRRSTSIDLGLGEPTLTPDMRFFEIASRAVAKYGCPYTPNSGDPALREAIAEHYGYPGMRRAANVCVTNGSQEALFTAVGALLDPAKDSLLVVEPAFGSYAKIAELAGITVRTVAMTAESGFAFDVDRIVAAITDDTRMIAICSPCNPTGRVFRSAQAQALAEHLLQCGGPPIYVLFDEVYRELTYCDDAANFAELYPYTIAINSLSKSNALTGMRIGWAIAPDSVIDSIIKMHSWATSTASTYAQHVALAIFREPGALSAQFSWYREQADRVRREIADRAIEATPIEGAFYSLLHFPKVSSSLDAALALAEHDDVLMIPGSAFGSAAEGYLRMSWVAPIASIATGLTRAQQRFT